MAKIIFKRGDETFDINMPEGARVVHAAHKLKLPEIPADCRGQCQCGTCHVHVDPSWLDKINPMDLDSKSALPALLYPTCPPPLINS